MDHPDLRESRPSAAAADLTDGAEVVALRAQLAQLQRERDEARDEVARLRQRAESVEAIDREGRINTAMAERLRVEAERRMLAEAAELLASSLDYTVTLEQTARLAVKDLCDVCGVIMRESPERSPRVVALIHRDPALAERMRELARGFAAEAENPVLAQVMRDGRSYLQETMTPEVMQATIADPHQLEVTRDELKVQSSMAVALPGRERVLGVLVLLSCTPQRRFGPQDLSLAEELARRAALAVERAQLYAEAQEAVRSREEFLSIASHELRSPLNTLSLQVQLLLRAARGTGGIASITEERLTQMLDSCERQLRRVTALINRLFDLSRLLSGRLDLNLEDVALGALAREVLARFDEELQRTGSAARVLELEGVVGHWDRLRLDQVLTNLVSNAVKYGEGRPIQLTVEREGGLARLTVTDEGMGIPQEHQARIFERFERATPHRSPGSLGLGLYIVRRVLTLMGGSISVRSQPGVGSSFVVELPLG